MSNSEFWTTYKEVDEMLKQAFIQMPGGQGGAGAPPAGDPAAAGGGMPPPGMDPAAMGLPPGIDPSMMGGMPPPGMDPSMMGGMPPPGMDPMAMGMPPPGAEDPAAGGSAPGSPMITISLDQLFEIIQKVLGLAKKVGVNGAGVQQPTPAPEAAGLTQDQLKATIYEALGQMAG